MLLTSDLADLAFDVKGHKCLAYSGINELDRALTRELAELKQRHLI